MENHPKIQVTPQGDLLLNFGEYGRKCELAVFSGDGRRLLTVHDVGAAHVWDTDSKKLLQIIRPTSALDGTDVAPTTAPFRTFIESAALNSNGSVVVLGLNDGSAAVFSIESAEQLARMQRPGRSVAVEGEARNEGWELIRAVCFSPDGTHIALGHYDRCVSVWNDHGNRLLQYLCPPSSHQFVTQGAWARDAFVSSVGISAENRFVFAGSADAAACIWDLETNHTVLDATEHAATIIELFASDTCIRWATSDGSVWQVDPNSRPRKVLQTGQNWWAAVFSPCGTHLLTRAGQEEIYRWQLQVSASS